MTKHSQVEQHKNVNERFEITKLTPNVALPSVRVTPYLIIALERLHRILTRLDITTLIKLR